MQQRRNFISLKRAHKEENMVNSLTLGHLKFNRLRYDKYAI